MEEVDLPFRWDVARDQLGTLLDGVPEPDLWFADELVVCAARILARSADGDLRFVGRSLDSAYDLLTGALDETPWRGRMAQLPLSARGGVSTRNVWRMRTHLAQAGLDPAALARRRRPLVLVDLVAQGGTFEGLY